MELANEPKGPFHYTLHLDDLGSDARRLRQTMGDGRIIKNFDREVRQSRCPKIYVVRKDREVLYVGYADQHIGSRLRYGLNPKHQRGYHGFGWKDYDEVELLDWVFDVFPLGIVKTDDRYKKYKRLIECVESEIVFRIKQITRRWPDCQQEIHFGNDHSAIVNEVTNKIVNYLGILDR